MSVKTSTKTIALILNFLILFNSVAFFGQDRQSSGFPEPSNEDAGQIFKNLTQHGRRAEFPALLEKIFGGETQTATDTTERIPTRRLTKTLA